MSVYVRRVIGPHWECLLASLNLMRPALAFVATGGVSTLGQGNSMHLAWGKGIE